MRLFTDTLGWVLVCQGKAEEALPFLEHTVRHLPKAPESRWHLARALELLKRYDAALEHLVVAFELSTTFAGVNEARALERRLRNEIGL